MTPDVHTLVGPYLLDALGADERAAFEAHLAECEACAEEVDSLRSATAALAEPVPADPPSDLRRRVLAAAAATPQEAPLVGSGRPARPERRHRRRRWALVAAAAVAVVALGAGVTAVVTHDEPTHPSAAQVMAAPDVRMHKMPTQKGEVMIAMSHRMRMVAVDTTHLARPDKMTYQVWWHTAAGMRSAGVLDAGRSLVAPVEDGDLMLTMEPEGGSRTPSGRVLLTMPSADL